MYVTYCGHTYVIEASYNRYYDLGDPDGIKETMFNVPKEKCSEERDMYDEDEWLEEQSEEEEE